jgi:hypothetical protein
MQSFPDDFELNNKLVLSAFAQLLIPDDLLFVRFAGTRVVAVSIFGLHFSLACASVPAGFLSAALTVVTISVLVPSGQLEHVAPYPLLCASGGNQVSPAERTSIA